MTWVCEQKDHLHFTKRENSLAGINNKFSTLCTAMNQIQYICSHKDLPFIVPLKECI